MKVSWRDYGDLKISYERQLREADDRRYTEVNIEKEKALKIKEEADKVALSLAREIQTYKDEAHNGLLKQHAEFVSRAVSAEKFEAVVKPLADYVASQQGRSTGLSNWYGYIVAGIMAVVMIIQYFK